MPHVRPRYADNLIQRALKHSPIVGAFGQRQVGKSTLISKMGTEYCTLDSENTLLELNANPKLFVENRPQTFVIDEAQLVPRLFPALKEFVRTHPRKGQFILSGSMRFTSRRVIRESLTGRIATVEILPFTHSEAHEYPLPNMLKDLTMVRNQRDLEQVFKKRKRGKKSDFERFLIAGGLPGICFYRSADVRAERWQAQLDTLLNRDLRLIQNTSLPYESLRALLEYLALHQGEPFEIKKAVSASQISAVTIKRLLFAFENLFLIRMVRSTGDQKKSTYFLEDQGLASWIARRGLVSSIDIVRGLYANLRQELHYRPELNGRVYQYRTKHDVVVPLVFDGAGVRLGIVASLDQELRPKTIGTAQAFVKKHRGFKCVIAYAGSEVIVRSENVFLIPFEWLL